jgi:hypothetical protein
MGNKFVHVGQNGTITELAFVSYSPDPVTMDYSFDRLMFCSNGALYYWDGTSLEQVIDSDLGTVISLIWVDGYTMATDGESIVVTELSDPFSVNPLKYGSSEVDPDKIKGLCKLRGEPSAVNRYTIEFFDNVGGSGFPYERIKGAQIQRGAIGTRSFCVFGDRIAFLGSGRNEPPAIWVASNGTSQKVSTREIDQLLSQYTEAELAQVVVETRTTSGHQFLYVHLPDQALVYDEASSIVLNELVWVSLASSVSGNSTYRARNFVWCYDMWIVGDPTSSKLGVLSTGGSSHYGEIVGWEFNTVAVYNENNGALVHNVELVCLTGHGTYGEDPSIWTSYSIDGELWSQERVCKAGVTGNRVKRINWLQQGSLSQWRVQKFRGTSDAHLAVARLDMTLEPLYA